VVERKASRPKGNPAKPAPTRDHFERLLDAPCPHHQVPVKHTLRECRLMKNYVKSTLLWGKPQLSHTNNKRRQKLKNQNQNSGREITKSSLLNS
jgi:hypothetical protein